MKDNTSQQNTPSKSKRILLQKNRGTTGDKDETSGQQCDDNQNDEEEEPAILDFNRNIYQIEADYRPQPLEPQFINNTPHSTHSDQSPTLILYSPRFPKITINGAQDQQQNSKARANGNGSDQKQQHHLQVSDASQSMMKQRSNLPIVLSP